MIVLLSQVCDSIILQYLLKAKSCNMSDSLYYVTDPDVEHIPLEELLGKVRALDSGRYSLSQFSISP